MYIWHMVHTRLPQSPMTCKHSSHHGTTSCTAEMKKKALGFCRQKVTDCFREESLPNRLSDRYFWGVQEEGNHWKRDPQCIEWGPQPHSRSAVISDKVWLAVWVSVISPSLDFWRSTCGRRRFKQAVTSWLRTLDPDLFLLSSDNGKFPRSLLPYIIPLMCLGELHPGFHTVNSCFLCEARGDIE
jgi:hypothetical protein